MGSCFQCGQHVCVCVGDHTLRVDQIPVCGSKVIYIRGKKYCITRQESNESTDDMVKINEVVEVKAEEVRATLICQEEGSGHFKKERFSSVNVDNIAEEEGDEDVFVVDGVRESFGRSRFFSTGENVMSANRSVLTVPRRRFRHISSSVAEDVIDGSMAKSVVTAVAAHVVGELQDDVRGLLVEDFSQREALAKQKGNKYESLLWKFAGLCAVSLVTVGVQLALDHLKQGLAPKNPIPDPRDQLILDLCKLLSEKAILKS